MTALAEHFFAPPAPELRPIWLRPVALAAILAAHAALFMVIKPPVEQAPSLESLDIALVPLGDSVQDQKQIDEIKPAEAPPPPPEAVAPPPPAELTAPPPEVKAPEAPPLPVAKPVETKPSPAELRKIEREKRLAEEKREERAEARREAREKERRKAQEARQEAHRGAANGSARASGMSPAAYAGYIVAELNRHKFFPAAARAAGVTGSVGVAFTIGPSGRVVSQSITRSSGNGALDGAARVIMSAIHAPPPPGGRFSTATSIRFNLR